MTERGDSAFGDMPGGHTTAGRCNRRAGSGTWLFPAHGRALRPARIAAGAATVLAAGALLTGCGDMDDASNPRHVKGNAAPAGLSPNGSKKGGNGGEDNSADNAGKKGKDNGASQSGGSSSSGANGSAGSDGNGDSTGGGSDGASSGSDGAGANCTTADLSASIGPNRPGAGQNHFALIFTNKSGRPCTVKGFPGFAFINASGKQVSVPPQREGGGAQAVELGAGSSAWAPLSYANPQVSGARSVTPDAALLTPPDQQASLRVDWSGGPAPAAGEGSVPKIGPLSPGTG
ncbi:DUF4232 domain-containing protein [Streptomyces oryzae]|uniref:DUF4232 domain-containing protein n=1 Tax=Streptomyces oryzae TaxID=1434886 RepID=A0ABS3XCT2_9ACTN|nr:DUF4232 domain-containing protein [Streptomyces oryzae]MBO8193089.1 DUF4232 domain-containing protein [Streptomyces oryzae]